MGDLYDRVREEMDERLPEESLLSYSREKGRDAIDRVKGSRKLQAGIAAGVWYYHKGLFTERYGFIDRSETHSFIIGFSDGYASGDPIGHESAPEAHYYAKGKITGTAFRNGQDWLAEYGDVVL